ncbi:hypothetical protein [Roseospirillum parvum]|uniref:Predicted kinase, aminoglycoside phosphotransferase (APT) family n=1 Tax=Roseospirillum parvum TaxID=83401 RepID=A0A1G7TV53_9PROT|nr:hypothetical protein [Roseospirillum parvum]SDG39142.1 Predicted kinase, aminoglycoside phosphotransferase (APT) family [Roseospirillum parvum]
MSSSDAAPPAGLSDWLAAGLELGSVRLVPILRGRNNAVFRAEGVGRRVAVKVYPPAQAGPCDRLDHEWRALSFLAAQGVAAVPRPLLREPRRRWAAYSWLDGAPPDAAMAARAVAEGWLVDFLARLHGLRHHPEAAALPPAAESGLVPLAPRARLAGRLGALRDCRPPDDCWAASLGAFLDRVEAVLAPRLDQAEARISQLGFDPQAPLPAHLSTLSPSDVGLHNMLVGAEGAPRFLDFEYFGRDDPVKLVSDTLLHPGSAFQPAQRARLKADLIALYGADDATFAARLEALMPLYVGLWCLILLNEFRPEAWRRRLAAGLDPADHQALLGRQLARAERYLRDLEVAG